MNHSILAVLAACAVLQAQQPRPVTADQLREHLSFLASDELAGRDTPSPGLERAADYIIEAFRRAGLEPGNGESYQHEYTLPGVRIDLSQVSVAFEAAGERVVLKGGDDVRVWQSSVAFDQKQTEVRVVAPGDLGGRRGMAARNPMLITVAADSPLWRTFDGSPRLAGRRLRNAPPMLLVRTESAPPAGELKADVRVPAPTEVDVPLRNPVAMIEGTDLKDEFVVIGAHYDHVGVRPTAGGDFIFNGADDDGTGTTAVIALAQAFAKRQPELRRSLVFTCFSGEEKGLRGSRAWVEDPPIPLDKIAAMVNLEMLGRPKAGERDFAWVTGRDLSDFEAFTANAFRDAEIELVEFEQQARLFFASDNAAFARRGVVAHSISAGWLHEDYHGPNDEPDRIRYDHMANVCNGIYGAILEFANRDDKPRYNDQGKQRIQGGRRRRR